MIRADRFALDADTFAAERRNILDRADKRFTDAVRTSLIRLGLPGWDENIVQMALDIFEETARSETDQWNPIIDDMRDEFERELKETLAKTKVVDKDQFDMQVERLTKWLSTYSVNAGTEAATTSDTDNQVGLEWVTMHDDKVRHTHREANGETVPSGETFEVGGFKLLYPGQPVGPPEIWINCRCVARPAMLEGFKVKTEEFAADPQLVDQLPVDSAADGSGHSSQMSPDPSVTASVPAPQDPMADASEVDLAEPTEIPEEELFTPVPWHGVLAPEGVPSGDGRQFDPNGLTHRDLPLPLKAMFIDDDGHKGSVIVGRIDNIFRDNGLVKGEGVFDTSEAAYETIRMLAEGMWSGVSVDVDDMQASLSEDGNVMSATGRICAATICAIPAFAEAFVGLGPWADQVDQPQQPEQTPQQPQLGDQSPEDVSRETAVGFAADTEVFDIPPIRTMDGPGWITSPKPTHRITAYWVDGRGALKIKWGVPGDFNRCRTHLAKYVQNPKWLAGLCANLHYRAIHVWPGRELGGRGHHGHHTLRIEESSMVASAEAPVLDGRYFKNPELVGPTPFTVTEDGRVYGHVATWDACHIGLPMGDEEGDCTTAPHSATNYAFFLTGEVATDLGPVAVGQISLGGGHASAHAGVRAAISHYDSTSTAVADVTAGEDDHGIWVAGVLRPGVTDEQVRALRAAAISGDWRRVKPGADLEMVAALAVNVPGFPIPRPSMLVASGGEVLTLTAAAIPLADGQDSGGSLEIETSVTDRFNAQRAKFRALEVARAKSVFATTGGE